MASRDAGSPWLEGASARGVEYDRRFEQLAAGGHDVHGEAGLVSSLGVTSVLDAGCGTGRVAIELARRGLDVVGVDLDPSMLSVAAAKAPALRWVRDDLATVSLGRRFDAVLLAGNVLLFLAPGTEGPVLDNLVAHLHDEGLVVAGFSLGSRLELDAYDELVSAAGCRLVQRWSTWERAPFRADAGYAVSVHVNGVGASASGTGAGSRGRRRQ